MNIFKLCLSSFCQGPRGPDGYKGEQGRPGASVGRSKSTFVAQLFRRSMSGTNLLLFFVMFVCSFRATEGCLDYQDHWDNQERRW